ncbi:MAG: hypothetical protein ACREMI_11635 [Gemmatimonadales bacterium]
MRIMKLAVSAAVIGGALLSTIHWTLARSAEPTPPPAQDTTRVSAGLLRRLAAAADGYRTGEPIWIVTSTAEPYSVVGAFPTLEEARSRASLVRGAHAFGPYVTPRDLGRVEAFVPTRHFRPTIYMLDSSYAWRPPLPPLPFSDLDSVVITAYTKSGRTWRGLTRGDVDAVFFTLSAHDKFVAPYYAALSGLDVAGQMRDTLLHYIRRLPERP